jgi:hypothetical protein
MCHTRSRALTCFTVLTATLAMTVAAVTRAGAEGINDLSPPLASQVLASQVLASQVSASQPLVLAVLMDRDRRGSPYANSHAHVGATGLVRCGNRVGTAQLVLRRDIIVTAAHVLFGSGGHGDCVFLPRMGSGEPIAIETATIQAGSRTPLSQAATRDWAVARLVAPVSAATPYVLGAQMSQPGAVTLCAAGNGGATQFGAENCTVRSIVKTAGDGVRELAIDCSGSPGGSGGAIIAENGAITGIYVGDRSTNPSEAQPYSKTHYNFGITIEGAFRRALLAQAH